MPTTSDMRWFKTNFQDKINAAIAGTPFTLDLMTALACQETGEIWPILRKTDLSLDRILALCVGDTLDAPNRSAFPKNKAALLAENRGQEMFEIARQALVEMAQFIDSYKGAASNPNKFCHGYGMFQFDLQFFKTEPDYFLEKRYAKFDETLGKALGELESARKKIGLGNKAGLSDLELCHVAIAYNTGHFNPAKGLKQGFAPKDKHGNIIGPFYGEQILDFIQKSKTVTADGSGTTTPTSDTTTAATFKVTASGLNLRSEPSLQGTVKVTLPNGQRVRAVAEQVTNGFREVETDFQGQHLQGFCSAKFLVQVMGTTG
ncbi:MAG TPA: SH3 domain-containing protein [Blastocatellia bacterium]|nr:SH3 domain-containing protein [Blastocatellia bacterium]